MAGNTIKFFSIILLSHAFMHTVQFFFEIFIEGKLAVHKNHFLSDPDTFFHHRTQEEKFYCEYESKKKILCLYVRREIQFTLSLFHAARETCEVY